MSEYVVAQVFGEKKKCINPLTLVDTFMCHNVISGRVIL